MEVTSFESTYQAASKVAGNIATHFLHHLNLASENGEEDLAFAPDASVIEKIIDVAFWASLRREEGVPIRISLAFLPPSH